MTAEQLIKIYQDARREGFGNAAGAITASILADLAGFSQRQMQRYLARMCADGYFKFLGKSTMYGGYKLTLKAA